MYDQPIRFSPNIESAKEIPVWYKRIYVKLILTAFLLIIVTVSALTLYLIKLNQPSINFPINEPITIKSGTDVRTITQILESEGVIKSKDLLYYLLVFLYEPASLKASTYVFEEPITTKEVAERLAEGDFDTDLIRFTHFEGERALQIASRAENVLPNFKSAEFINRVKETQLEGKLFPETYFVPSDYDNDELLDLLLETFKTKINTLSEAIETHSLTLEEILILASIVEREANSPESMRYVSGILQNRLDINMPLQADASIEYILDKPLSELTPEDLEIDSPYNTYLNVGLPPTPIGNPGLEAITAVLEPTQSDYFYYITDTDGEFHYAETYQNHLINIEKYLR